jgi:hypothetical protein
MLLENDQMLEIIKDDFGNVIYDSRLDDRNAPRVTSNRANNDRVAASHSVEVPQSALNRSGMLRIE